MKKTMLITGAGRGIGRALAAFAFEQGNDVIALVRTKVREVASGEVINGVDVTNQEVGPRRRSSQRPADRSPD